jgi:hypothetical protein
MRSVAGVDASANLNTVVPSALLLRDREWLNALLRAVSDDERTHARTHVERQLADYGEPPRS